MKAEAVIAMVRRDVETMWQKHLNWLATGGQEGIPCLDIPSMERLRNRTDLEILDKALSKGMYIPDYEEYKAHYPFSEYSAEEDMLTEEEFKFLKEVLENE